MVNRLGEDVLNRESFRFPSTGNSSVNNEPRFRNSVFLREHFRPEIICPRLAGIEPALHPINHDLFIAIIGVVLTDRGASDPWRGLVSMEYKSRVDKKIIVIQLENVSLKM